MQQATIALHWIKKNAVITALLVAYIVMSMLIFEQGRTIDSQRTLIRLLFSDSLELNAKKMQELKALNEHKH